MIFWVWAIIVILLIVVLLSLKIKIEIIIIVHEDELDQGLQLKIHAFMYNSQHNYEYTDPRLRLWESLLIDVMNNRTHQEEQGWLQKIRAIRKHSLENRTIFDLASQYIFIDELEWTTQVGSQDALYTAMGTGWCWALQGTIIAWLSNHFKLGKVKIDVKPNFTVPAFLSNCRCILKIRMVHIIIIKAYASAIKVRGRINGFTARTIQSSH